MKRLLLLAALLAIMVGCAQPIECGRCQGQCQCDPCDCEMDCEDGVCPAK